MPTTRKRPPADLNERKSTKDPDQEALRIRRSEITAQLTALRLVIKDLENHPPPNSATMDARIEHFKGLEDAKDKLRELDLEYIRLT